MSPGDDRASEGGSRRRSIRPETWQRFVEFVDMERQSTDNPSAAFASLYPGFHDTYFFSLVFGHNIFVIGGSKGARMKKRVYLGIVAACMLPLGVWAFLAWYRPSFVFAAAATLDRPPSIRPDYRDTVIPPNIARSTSWWKSRGRITPCDIHAAQGEAIELRARTRRL